MKIDDYKMLFVTLGLIGILLFASPMLINIIRLPAGQQFSELYLLGPNHMIQDYPYNVEINQNYRVYIGVVNNLRSTAYYTVYLKFQNETDMLPNATSVTASSSLPIYELKFFLPDGGRWESPIDFSISEALVNANQSSINGLSVNGLVTKVDKSAALDANTLGFHYGLICELWVYNVTISNFQYNNRYVNLQLNLIEPK